MTESLIIGAGWGGGAQEEKFSDRENRLIIKVMAEKEKMEWKRDIVSFLLHG